MVEIYAAHFSHLLMVMILFAPGIAIYVLGRRRAGERAFGVVDGAIALAIVAPAIVSDRDLRTSARHDQNGLRVT